MVKTTAWEAENPNSRPGLDYLTVQLFSCILQFGVRSKIEGGLHRCIFGNCVVTQEKLIEEEFINMKRCRKRRERRVA